MKVTVDEHLHHEHSEALATQLVKDTLEVLEQYGLFTRAQNADLAKDLLFRICAVLDGSAHPGEINGESIAPFVGFYLAHDTENVLVPEDGSAMHHRVDELVENYHSPNATGT
jgi:hypothetical protein